MTRAIIVTNSATATTAAKNQLTAYLEGRGWSVWHWFEDVWLLDGLQDDFSMSDTRDQIKTMIPARHQFMILSTEGLKQHAGLVPRDSLPWLKEHWYEK